MFWFIQKFKLKFTESENLVLVTFVDSYRKLVSTKPSNFLKRRNCLERPLLCRMRKKWTTAHAQCVKSTLSQEKSVTFWVRLGWVLLPGLMPAPKMEPPNLPVEMQVIAPVVVAGPRRHPTSCFHRSPNLVYNSEKYKGWELGGLLKMVLFHWNLALAVLRGFLPCALLYVKLKFVGGPTVSVTVAAVKYSK